MARSVILSVLAICVTARGSNVVTQHSQYSFQDNFDDIDISGSKFLGLTTYSNLPYAATCFEKNSGDDLADIYIIGAPFDTGVSARPGARYGPSGIRSGSSRIAPAFNYDLDNFNAFRSWATILDCGDVGMIPFDNRIALAQLQKAHELVLARPAKNTTVGSIPRIITLGGDHTISLPALRAAHKVFGPVAVLHFDSHIDTWSPETLPHGRPTSKYAGVNHGTWGWHAYHEGLISKDGNLHVGIRAPYAGRQDIETDRACGFEILPAKAIDRIGVDGVIKKIKDRIGGQKVYLSVDIDVLDPAFAPATGTPEVGGYSTRELIAILDGLEGLNIIGADVVEVAPAYDGPGEITSLAGASIAHSILGLMVKQPVKS